MKQTKLFFVMMLMLVMSNAFTSCQKDVVVLQEIQEQETLDNPALVTKLKALGFTFEGNALVIDDKVQNTTSLDLSGAKLTSAEGLQAFPALTQVNLSDNHFTNTFDFAVLPETVKSVNLAGNDLFQFEGLATVNDDGFTLQRELTELTLPASARFNVDLLPYYYNETKETVTLKMQNPTNNQIEPYTTLRNIPDENLRNYIKNAFPSIMKGEQVDLLASFADRSALDVFLIGDISNLEGVQYIINNPKWEGAQILIMPTVTKGTLPYIKVPKTVQLVALVHIDTPYLDFSSAKELRYLYLRDNPSVEVADFSHSEKFMKRPSSEQINQDSRYGMAFINCPNLTEIKVADDVKTSALHSVVLVNLPKLKKFDMTKINGLGDFNLGEISEDTQLTLPVELTYNIEHPENMISISITEDMTTNTQIKDFILKCNTTLNTDGRPILSWNYSDLRQQYDIEPVDYRKLWKL